MDKAEQEILDTIRDEYTVEQMLMEEGILRRANAGLYDARAALSTMKNRPDLSDLNDLIDEVDAAIDFFREARRA